MNTNQNSGLHHFLVCTFAALALCASFGAHAEYLCNKPPTRADQKACDLAKLDSPDPLRQFIQRTKVNYGLYMPDYVSDKDVQRWEKARQIEETKAAATKDNQGQIKSVSR